MDLEEISKNLESSMDPQNVTAAVLSLIVQFGSRERKKRPSESVGNQSILHQSTAVEGNEASDAIELAHNLSTILLSYYQNDTAFLETLTNNLRDEEVRWMKEANRRLSDVTLSIVVTIYIIVIALGSFGNLVVVSSFIRQPSLRTPRNSFILNLAVSDLLLCLVTMPLTLLDIVNKHWPLGDSALSCKVAGGLQAVSVFVSTISITVIALDRYQLILYPTKDVLKRIGSAVAVFFIWMLGFLLALPIFMVRTLEHRDLDAWKGGATSRSNSNQTDLSIDFCYEEWPVSQGRVIYSASTLVIQYALPFLIISILHTKICQRLRIRHTAVELMAVCDSGKRIKAAKRLRRRHNLLIATALIFSITWLPLNVLNMATDLHNLLRHPEKGEKMVIIYAICHLFGMSSACANPFLYGWFNDNFRNEFIRILSAPFRLCYKAESIPIVVSTRSSTATPKIDDNPAEQQGIELFHRQGTVDIMAERTDGSVWVEPSSLSKLGKEDVIILNQKRKLLVTSFSMTMTEDAISLVRKPVYIRRSLGDVLNHSSVITKTGLLSPSLEKETLETYL